MNYYTTDNENKIIEVSIFGCEPHWLNCNQTEEEIVRCENQLMLKSEFETLSQTDEYIAEQERLEQEAKNKEIYKQLEELDLKSIRALRSNDVSRLELLEAQAAELRKQLQ